MEFKVGDIGVMVKFKNMYINNIFDEKGMDI